jgi:hypothetical protein
MEKMGQEQPRRPRSDDSDLCAHPTFSLGSQRCRHDGLHLDVAHFSGDQGGFLIGSSHRKRRKFKWHLAWIRFLARL